MRSPRELADLFRRCADGRREYLRSINGDARFGDAPELLRIETAALDAVARVIDGDLGPLYNWLPSHRWTPDMLDRLYGTDLAEQDAQDAAPPADEPSPLDGAMHSVWLHGRWRWLTRNMTTSEREGAADAVERHHRWMAISEHEEPGKLHGLRWWDE